MGFRPFHFQAAGLQHRDFKKLLEEKWEDKEALPASLMRLFEDLTIYNKETFENIFKRKKKIQLNWKGYEGRWQEAPQHAIKIGDKIKKRMERSTAARRNYMDVEVKGKLAEIGLQE